MKEAYLLVQFAQIPKNVDIIKEKEEQNSEQTYYKDVQYSNNNSKEKIIQKYVNSNHPQNQPPVYTLPLIDGAQHSIHQDQITHWQHLYPAVDIMQELRLMQGWLETHTEKAKNKKNIANFINYWLANSQKNAAQKSQPKASPSYQSRFVNYQQRTWDFEELARLERERLRQTRQKNDGTSNP